MSAAGPDLSAAQLQAAATAEQLRSEGKPLVGYVVGDRGSGKTTMMELWRSGRAPSSDPPAGPGHALRCGDHLLQDPVKIFLLLDSSPPSASDAAPMEEDEGRWAAYHRANVVVLAFPATPEGADRVRTYWLEELRLYNVTVPIVAVATKADEAPQSRAMATSMHRMLQALTRARPNSLFMEATARMPDTCLAVLRRAQLLVAFPPLVLLATDAATSSARAAAHEAPLCSAAREALLDVFRRLDADGDGVLDEHEIAHMERACFDEDRSPQQIEAIMGHMRRHMGADAVAAGGLTPAGFLALIRTNLRSGHPDKAWMPLLRHGYTLRLKQATP